jgi:hypothetical protein
MSDTERSPTLTKLRDESPKDCTACGEDDRSWFCGAERYEEAIVDLEAQLAGTIEALLMLAAIHHGTITPSKLHDPHNRDWTECEAKSCRLAQPFGEQ